MPPSDKPSLAATGLSKRYGALEALRDASVDVSPGEVLALIGPNGSGKTTLLDTIAGLLDADRGAVSIGGSIVEPAARSKGLFYLPDGIRPWPDQALGWVLRMTEGLFRGSAATRMMVIDRLGLAPLLGARLGTLSKGEHKRAMLALAVNTPQPVLLLDEPFDGLDLRQTREVMALLKEHAATGRALILSIHQLTDAARIADRMVLLNNGVVVGAGSLAELQTKAGVRDASVEEVFLALT